MPINYPNNQNEVFNRAIADFQNELPDAGPFLRNNFVYALIVAFSARIFDNYQLLMQLQKQMFPDSATDDFLARWGGYKHINPLTAKKASGRLTVTGLVGSNIPIDTEFQTSDGRIYKSISPATIAQQTYNITSIERSGNIVTVTLPGTFYGATGILVNIVGADQPEYNGEFLITVTGDNTFIYTVNGDPTTPATSSNLNGLQAIFYGTSVIVESDDTGSKYNIESGTNLTLLSPLSGVDTFGYVQFSEITGATDGEENERYRKRVIYAYQNPVALFNIAAITLRCKELPQVDRVFVKPITPYIGAVTVYFTVDKDSIIPAAEDVSQVLAHLQEIRPAHMDSNDVIVVAPAALPVNFTIQNLVPNTISMQDAVRESLRILFREETEVGVPLNQAAYMSAIWQTVDLNTGDIVESFSMGAPNGNVGVAANQIPTLGTVTFI